MSETGWAEKCRFPLSSCLSEPLNKMPFFASARRGDLASKSGKRGFLFLLFFSFFFFFNIYAQVMLVAGKWSSFYFPRGSEGAVPTAPLDLPPLLPSPPS